MIYWSFNSYSPPLENITDSRTSYNFFIHLLIFEKASFSNSKVKQNGWNILIFIACINQFKYISQVKWNIVYLKDDEYEHEHEH